MKHLLEVQNKREAAEEEIVGKQHFVLESLIFTGIMVGVPQLLTMPHPAYRYFFYFVVVVYFVDVLYNGTAYRSYGVSSRGLTEYVFGRRKRHWSWNLVEQIGRQKDAIAYDYFGTKRGVIITLHGAPHFDPSKNKGSKAYYHEWRPRVLFVNNAKDSVSVLEKYYGKLDY